MRRLVFLCIDNVCASPYAERRAHTLGLPAVSAGLRAAPGTDVPAHALAVASRRGILLTGHRPRRFELAGVLPGDLLIGFEPAVCAHIATALGRDRRAQIALLALGERGPGPCEASADAGLVDRLYARIDLALMRMHEARPIDRTSRGL